MTGQPQPSEKPEPKTNSSLKEAWRALPFSMHLTGYFGGAFILLTIAQLLSGVFSSNPAAEYEKIRINGETAQLGIYDPSVAFTSENAAWLAYSALAIGKDASGEPLVEVHLAMSSDAGKNWNYAGTPVFTSRNETLYQADGMTPMATGITRYEVPGLVYDPEDKGREWKIFSYRYFWNGDVALAERTAVIALKYASDPLGKWSDEIWLFSARPGIPPAPYDRLVLLSLSRLSPDLADVTSFSEPAPFMKDGRLYLLLTAFTGADQPTRLVLIASNDHGNSWYYIGSPLSFKDAGKKEITRVSGGSFSEANGKVYLLAGFGDEKIRSYGASVFEVSDLSLGKLRRDQKSGLPVMIEKIEPPADMPLVGMGAGSASWDRRASKGVMLSQTSLEKSKPVFNIFYTLQKVGKKD